MIRFNWKENIAIVKLMGVLCLILGGLYPLSLTAIGQAFFPNQAQGSLIYLDHKIIGSVYLGQTFTSPTYFKGRPSLTDYQSDEWQLSELMLWGSPALNTFVEKQRALWQQASYIPSELLYPSASMLDPHISWMGVVIQLADVAKARNITVKELYDFVEGYAHGIEAINVMELNLALDKKWMKS